MKALEARPRVLSLFVSHLFKLNSCFFLSCLHRIFSHRLSENNFHSFAIFRVAETQSNHPVSFWPLSEKLIKTIEYPLQQFWVGLSPPHTTTLYTHRWSTPIIFSTLNENKKKRGEKNRMSPHSSSHKFHSSPSKHQAAQTEKIVFLFSIIRRRLRRMSIVASPDSPTHHPPKFTYQLVLMFSLKSLRL